MRKIYLITLIAIAFFSCQKEKEKERKNNSAIRPITSNSSAYVSKLIEYKPAPGQFINTDFGNLEAAKSLEGKKSSIVLSLGGFGGYAVYKFDHTVLPQENQKELIVYANAFDGSTEAGIVQVMFDENANGLADDTWYELAGSEYSKEETLKNYTITYTNPKVNANIPWYDNNGKTGKILINSSHKQKYYPEFVENQLKLTFTGTCLKSTKSKNEHNWVVLGNYDWGYVDNYSTDYKENGKANVFDLDWAIDRNGIPVKIKGVDFIKVYTGVNIDAEILGEVSTEISGIADLSLLN